MLNWSKLITKPPVHLGLYVEPFTVYKYHRNLSQIQDLVTKIKQTCTDICDIKEKSHRNRKDKQTDLFPFRSKGSSQ